MTDRTLATWRIRSEIPLPETLPWSGPDDHPVDVDIVLGETPETLDECIRETPVSIVGRDGRYIFTLPRVARYFVEEGRRITVTPRQDPAAPDVRLFLHTNCLSVLGMQRGYLALHGAAVEKDGQAFVFLGQSGLGKSTLAAALCREGYRLLAEDICLFTVPDADGSPPLILPTHPSIRLWSDALHNFGTDPATLVRSREGKNKYHLTKPDWFCPDPVPLRALFLLKSVPHSTEPSVSCLTGSRPVGLICQYVLRAWVARALKLEPSAFQMAIQLTRKRMVHSVSFPVDLSALGPSARDILAPFLNSDSHE